ncbi:MAG: S8 family serine peptidase [Acidimicrobiia bacterium]
MKPAPPPPPPPPPPTLACALSSGGPTAAAVFDGEGVSLVAVTEADDGTVDVVTHEAETPAAAEAFVDELEAAGVVLAVETNGLVQAVTTATDPRRADQWALDRVPFEDAWDTAGTLGDGVVVAIVDTGINGVHTDLAGQFVPGVDWVVDGRPGCADAHGHGTHVAGVIAAIENNAIGIAGAAPNVKLMPVRVLGQNGSGLVSDLADGIKWAVDHGADVINLSLGDPAPMPTVQAMVQYARDHGVVVVASAGNCNPQCSSDPEGTPDGPVYPAAYPEAISVAANALADDPAPPEVPPLPLVRAPFSRANGEVDLSAPGSAIWSTYPNNGYIALSGTSMASPYVAAAAALFLAMCPAVRADDTVGAVTLVTSKLTDPLSGAVIDLGLPGRDNSFGFGLIDPNAMLLSGCS